jgi:5-amino-6-(5-phospho-D-ribitylamino)uracil phosphatase
MNKGLTAYKMIVADLDGTLLKSDKTMSDYTLSVLRRCRSEGIKVVFATARSLKRARPYLGLDANDAIICHNGAAIYYGRTKISPFCIPGALDILRSLRDKYPQMMLIANSSETYYVNFDAPAFLKNSKAVLTDFTKLPAQPVESIYAGIDCDERIDEIRSYLPANMNIRKIRENLILIMNGDAKKLNALKIMAEKFEIDLNDVLTFGDDLNDIGMIKAAGKGVAVENAVDEVKSAADETAASNDDDGVAHFIEKNLFS